MGDIEALTDGPLLLDAAAAVAIVASGVAGLALLWRKVAVPFWRRVVLRGSRALADAIRAAPVIAKDVGRVRELVEVDVLGQLEAIASRVTMLDGGVGDHERRLDHIDTRIVDHETRIRALEETRPE